MNPFACKAVTSGSFCTSVSDDEGILVVRATTLSGAVVKVLSPYTEPDITNVATDGSYDGMPWVNVRYTYLD